MQFEDQVGELVCSKWNEDIYQIVKCLPEILTDNKNEQGVRYFARRITIHKYTFKPKKAELFHYTWLYKNDRTIKKFNDSMTKEIAVYLNNVIFEPKLNSYYFNTNEYVTAHFVVDKTKYKSIKKEFEDISFPQDVKKIGLELISMYIELNIMKPVNICNIKRADLEENEILCRIDIFRFEDDFVEPNNYLSPKFYRFFKIKKISLK